MDDSQTPPCRACASRCVGCHGSCEAYKAWQAEFHARKQAEIDARASDRLTNTYRVRVLRKMAKEKEWHKI